MESGSENNTIASVALEEMLSSLDSNSLVLTVNKRLKDYLHHQYADMQAASAWQTPEIHQISGWLTGQFERLVTAGLEGRRLLSQNQETLLWEQICDAWNSQASDQERLLRPSAAASTASDAWRLIHDWRIDLRQIADYPSRESNLLAAWLERFQSLCEDKGWLSQTLLADCVSRHIDTGAIDLPDRLYLAGFDELTVMQAVLIDTLARAGCSILTLESPGETSIASVMQCHDIREEIQRAASWALDRLQASPAGRTGIVVPRLNALRAEVERCFSATLHPETMTQASHGSSAIFNISLGMPLAEEPMVQDALLFLELLCHHRRIPLHRIGQLLRSRFLGDYETEWSCRAMLDKRLREREPPEISPGRFLDALDKGAGNPAACCKAFHARLESAIGLLQESETNDKKDWAAVIATLLETAGWPGQRGLDSREYQCREHFIAVLEELGSLDPAESATNYTETLRRLGKLVQQQVFQPQGENDAPIQISGPLETAGQRFDAIWVMNLDDENWPSRAEPNPLIPVAIQKAHDLPHASAEREARFAMAVTRRLLGSAPEVVISYPAMDGERELRPSPLIAELPFAELPAPEKSFKQATLATAELETLDDDSAPAVTPDTIPGGGYRLISDQAACPFRAYANHRLGTRKLEEAELGFDARARGTLLHRCMELFWNEVCNSHTLQTMPRDARSQVIQRCIDKTFEDNWQQTGLEESYLELEKSRIALLMESWIETIEMKRSPFTVVGTETDIELELEGLPLKLRADRIDELEDGRQIVIDYKSGKNSKPDWNSERLEEPQLPLYTLASEHPVAGALLAFINGKDIRLNGLVEEKNLLPLHHSNIYKGDWDELLGNWKQWLHALAAEVMKGRADIDPVDPIKTCRYCDLKSLCRIAEVRQELVTEDGDVD